MFLCGASGHVKVSIVILKTSDAKIDYVPVGKRFSSMH